MANYPQYGNYGYEQAIDPALRNRPQGPGFSDQADAGLKALTAGSGRPMSPAYGPGATPRPAPLALPMNPNFDPRYNGTAPPVAAVTSGSWLGRMLGTSPAQAPAQAPSPAPSLPSAPVSANRGRTPVPPLPMPDFIADNPHYPTQTAGLAQGYAPMADAPPWMMVRNTELQPGTPAYQQAMLPRMENQRPDGATLTAAGGSEPLYQRQYLTPQGSASGVTSIAPGRGSFSVMDQGNGGTIEGNVAAIDRQTEALRSLREARNPGITGGGLPAMGTQTQTYDPFSRPGDSWGDSGKREQEYQGLLRSAAGARPKQAAAMVAAAQGMLAPGQEMMKAQGAAATETGQQQAGLYKAFLDAQGANAKTAFDTKKWGQEYEQAQAKAQTDQQKATFDRDKSSMELFLKAPAAEKGLMANQLWKALIAARDAGDKEKAKDLEERWNLLNRFDPNFMNQLMQGQGQ